MASIHTVRLISKLVKSVYFALGRLSIHSRGSIHLQPSKIAPKLHFPFQYVNSSSVGKNFDGLNQYLGFQTGEEAEVPTSTGKAKVVRKKAVGD